MCLIRYMWATASSRAKEVHHSQAAGHEARPSRASPEPRFARERPRGLREPVPSHVPVVSGIQGKCAQQDHPREGQTGDAEEQQLDKDLKGGSLACELSQQLSEKYRMNISVDVSPGQSEQTRNQTTESDNERVPSAACSARHLGEPETSWNKPGIAQDGLRRELWSGRRGSLLRDEGAGALAKDGGSVGHAVAGAAGNQSATRACDVFASGGQR